MCQQCLITFCLSELGDTIENTRFVCFGMYLRGCRREEVRRQRVTWCWKRKAPVGLTSFLTDYTLKRGCASFHSDEPDQFLKLRRCKDPFTESLLAFCPAVFMFAAPRLRQET